MFLELFLEQSYVPTDFEATNRTVPKFNMGGNTCNGEGCTTIECICIHPKINNKYIICIFSVHHTVSHVKKIYIYLHTYVYC